MKIIDTTTESSWKPRIRLRSLIFYLFTLGALFLLYNRFGELQSIALFFTKAHLHWLIIIVILQLGTFYFSALNYVDVLAIKDLRVSWRTLFPATLVIQFLNQALPSASISGQVFFVYYLRKYRLSIAEAIGRAILEFATLYTAFGILFITCIVVTLRHGVFQNHEQIRFFIYLFTFLALIFLFVFGAIQQKRRASFTDWIINRIHSYIDEHTVPLIDSDTAHKHLEYIKTILDQIKSTLAVSVLKQRSWLFARATLWQIMVLILDIATLYVIPLALDTMIPFAVVFIVFTLTRFVSMIAFVPGALGIFEGSMTLMLISFGVAAHVAFAITILFRAFTFWLPMPAGWLLYRRYLRAPLADRALRQA